MRARFLALVFFLSATAHAGNAIVPASGAPADLVITNLESREISLLVTVYGPGRARAFDILTLAPGETTVRGHAASGMLRVYSDGRFLARLGETPAIPVDELPAEHVLPGGTNVVIANPWTIPAGVTLTLYDAEGRQAGRLYRLVPALDVLQVDAAAASVRVTSEVSVYVSGATEPQHTDAVPPPCSEPAFLGPPKPGRDEWLVVTRDALTSAKLTPQELAARRCDSAVELIEQ